MPDSIHIPQVANIESDASEGAEVSIATRQHAQEQQSRWRDRSADVQDYTNKATSLATKSAVKTFEAWLLECRKMENPNWAIQWENIQIAVFMQDFIMAVNKKDGKRHCGMPLFAAALSVLW
jgi:hypothetical protein